ncbi:MAG: SigE family RNA polymerase sigma factor [Aeromicrobium sp.]
MEALTAVDGARVRSDETTHFDTFFRASWPQLFRTVYAVAGESGAAEDALQSAFAKAYSSWHRIVAADDPRAYVRRMAINELLGVRRRSWWKSERGTDEPPSSSPVDSHEGSVVAHDEMWRLVLSLPVRQRAVIVLRYYEDLTEAQIADVLGCSRGTVKSQASAALATLRSRGELFAPGRPSSQEQS